MVKYINGDSYDDVKIQNNEDSDEINKKHKTTPKDALNRMFNINKSE